MIQDVLILPPDNFEFPLTILLGLAAIAAFPVIYLIVSYIVSWWEIFKSLFRFQASREIETHMFELAIDILEALPSTQVGGVQSAVYFYCMQSEKFTQVVVLINLQIYRSLPHLILYRSINHACMV